MNSPRPKQVTLEQLLQLKRTERPPAEFWSEFEREMRVKQLAAIVEPRPWWASFIRVGAKVSRYQLPVGAAAILALSFVTVSNYRTGSVASVYVAPAPQMASVPAAVETAEIPAAAPTQVVAVAQQPKAVVTTAPQVQEAVVATTGKASHVVALPEAAADATQTMNFEPTPSARAIAINLKLAQAADPGLTDVFTSRTLENRRQVSEPLSHVSTPGGSLRSRVMASAWAASASSSDIALHSSERNIRLSEDRMYDTNSSRIGGAGDRFSWKF